MSPPCQIGSVAIKAARAAVETDDAEQRRPVVGPSTSEVDAVDALFYSMMLMRRRRLLSKEQTAQTAAMARPSVEPQRIVIGGF